jgi:hypothetical protein
MIYAEYGFQASILEYTSNGSKIDQITFLSSPKFLGATASKVPRAMIYDSHHNKDEMSRNPRKEAPKYKKPANLTTTLQWTNN